MLTAAVSLTLFAISVAFTFSVGFSSSGTDNDIDLRFGLTAEQLEDLFDGLEARVEAIGHRLEALDDLAPGLEEIVGELAALADRDRAGFTAVGFDVDVAVAPNGRHGDGNEGLTARELRKALKEIEFGITDDQLREVLESVKKMVFLAIASEIEVHLADRHAPPPIPTTIVVAENDTLWAIADRDCVNRTVLEIARDVVALWSANIEIVGDDADELRVDDRLFKVCDE